MRVAKSTPSGVVWSKYPRAAMSAEWPRAAAVSRESTVSGLHPTFARSSLTIMKTAASAEVRPSGAGRGLAGGVDFPGGAGGAGVPDDPATKRMRLVDVVARRRHA